jgi:RNA polymerase sigma-70 factor (ECF subfamily)
MTNEALTHAEWVRLALERFETPLVRYAARLTGDLDRARDVVQDTFLKLCTAERDQIDGYLAQWLYRVCRNRALDVMKKEQRMQPLATDQVEARPSPAPTPRRVAEGHETLDNVLQAIDTLPDKQQEVFRLKFQDELSYKEISTVTGFPVTNVRYLIHCALKAMREQLHGRLEAAGEV